MAKNRTNTILVVMQFLLWICIAAVPALANWLYTNEEHQTFQMVMLGAIRSMLPLMVLYFVNYFLFIPKILFQKKFLWFILANIALYFLMNARSIFSDIPGEVTMAFPHVRFMGLFFLAVIYVFVILVAVGVRYMIRYNEAKVQMQEEKHKAAEAELGWLKYQLNPHFLFNTLNNISSLTQIDADQAQEKIGQLSDILRYALYDSDRDMVPLSGEVEFMNDYIDLMALRCNEMTKVEKSMDAFGSDDQIAPLIFISLIENAFKHGVNARKESFVRVDLHRDGQDVVFNCENSCFEKAGEDHIGSGIGLENMVKRLDLIYPRQYEYSHKELDGTYTATVRLRNILGQKSIGGAHEQS